VIKVLAQTFASAADTAVRTMVNLLFAVVVPQFANVTIIARSLCVTIGADITRFLGRAAKHAQHVLRHLSVQVMVLGCIVTVPASIPAATLKTLHLDIALVMLAAEDKLAVNDIVLFFLAMVSTVVVLRSIGWVGVAFAQVVGDVGMSIGGGRVRGRGVDF
jgi:hypothetical protein